MLKKPFGTHLILDADDCQGKINDRKHIQSFIDTLVKEMGMKKVGRPSLNILKIMIIIESEI